MKWTLKTADDFTIPFNNKQELLVWARKNKFDLQLDVYNGIATVYADNALYLDGERFIRKKALIASVPSGKTVIHVEGNNYTLKDAKIYVCNDKTFTSKEAFQAWLRVTGNVTSHKLVKTEITPGQFRFPEQATFIYTLG